MSTSRQNKVTVSGVRVVRIPRHWYATGVSVKLNVKTSPEWRSCIVMVAPWLEQQRRHRSPMYCTLYFLQNDLATCTAAIGLQGANIVTVVTVFKSIPQTRPRPAPRRLNRSWNVHSSAAIKQTYVYVLYTLTFLCYIKPRLALVFIQFQISRMFLEKSRIRVSYQPGSV